MISCGSSLKMRIHCLIWKILQVYVLFKDKEYTRQFEQEIEEVTKTHASMGIRELVLEKTKEEEREKTARNLVKISSLSDEQIATATDLSIDHVVRIRKELEGGE